MSQYKYHFQCCSVSSTSKYPARLQKESSHCSFASQFLWRECLVAVHQQPPQLALQFQQLPALRGLVNVLVPKSVVQGHREALPGTAGRLGVLDMSMEGRRRSFLQNIKEDSLSLDTRPFHSVEGPRSVLLGGFPCDLDQGLRLMQTAQQRNEPVTGRSPETFKPSATRKRCTLFAKHLANYRTSLKEIVLKSLSKPC